MARRAAGDPGEEPQLVGMLPTQLVRFAERRGYALGPLLDGLPEDLPHYASLGKRASWNQVTTLLERLHRTDPLALGGYAEHFLSEVPIVAHLLTYVVSVSGLYRFAFFAWQRQWPMARFRARRDGRRWILEARILPELRGSLPFQRLVAEVLRRLPRVQRRPDSAVRMIGYDDRAADWHVTVPDAIVVHEPTPEVIYQFVGQEVFNGPGHAPIERWGLSAAERRTVEALSTGLTVEGIAAKLGVSRETVRTHLKRAMHKAGVHSQVELLAALHRRAPSR